MKKKKTPLIYWDSPIFIDYLKGTSDILNGLDSIRSVLDELEKKHYTLITSALTYTEILESTMPAGSGEKFEQFMQNKDVIQTVAVDVNVAKTAQTLRNQLRKANKKKLTTPDAIHIATAMIHEVDFLHTFDDRMLDLNGENTVKNLTINPCIIPGTTYRFI